TQPEVHDRLSSRQPPEANEQSHGVITQGLGRAPEAAGRVSDGCFPKASGKDERSSRVLARPTVCEVQPEGRDPENDAKTRFSRARRPARPPCRWGLLATRAGRCRTHHVLGKGP